MSASEAETNASKLSAGKIERVMARVHCRCRALYTEHYFRGERTGPRGSQVTVAHGEDTIERGGDICEI